jgi:hypothetical protein
MANKGNSFGSTYSARCDWLLKICGYLIGYSVSYFMDCNVMCRFQALASVVLHVRAKVL